MDNPIILPAMPLRSFWASLPGEARIPYDRLEELARDGKLIGTYKQGRVWWINLLAHAQMGLSSEHLEKEETEGATGEGGGKRLRTRKQVVRPTPKTGFGAADGAIRHRR